MSWWTADPALTPLRVFDANSYEGTDMLSKTGDSQKMSFAGYSIGKCGSEAGQFKMGVQARPGASPGIVYSNAVATPSSGCYMALMKVSTEENNRATIPNIAPTSITGITFNYDGLGKGNLAFAGAGHSTPDGGTGLVPKWCVVGVYWTPTFAQAFSNNTFLGVGTNSPAAYISGDWVGVGNASQAGQGLHADLAAHGFWSGAATLSGMSAIANLMRTELVTADPVFSGGVHMPPSMFLGELGELTMHSGRAKSNAIMYADRQGKGIITGNVTEGTSLSSVAVARQVRLFAKTSGILLDEVWSESSGAYGFYGLDLSVEYFVVAHDHTRTYNAVVQDMIKP